MSEHGNERSSSNAVTTTDGGSGGGDAGGTLKTNSSSNSNNNNNSSEQDWKPMIAAHAELWDLFQIQDWGKDNPIAVDRALTILRKFPELAEMTYKHWSGRRDLPTLHHFFFDGVTLETIQAVYELYPDVLGTTEYKGQKREALPIQTACQSHGVSLEILAFLAEKCPEAKSKCASGKTPFRLFLERHFSPFISMKERCRCGQVEHEQQEQIQRIYELLLDPNRDLKNISNSDCRTVFQAVQKNCQPLINIFLEKNLPDRAWNVFGLDRFHLLRDATPGISKVLHKLNKISWHRDLPRREDPFYDALVAAGIDIEEEEDDDDDDDDDTIDDALPWSFVEALEYNQSLTSLKLYLDHRTVEKDCRRLASVLETTNTTLQDLSYEVNSATGFVPFWLHSNLRYYTLLNRHGRGQLRTTNELRSTEFIENLSSVIDVHHWHFNSEKYHVEVNILYGLLRESLSFWSGTLTANQNNNGDDITDE